MQPTLMLMLSLNCTYKHIFFHVANISEKILIPEFTKDCLVKFGPLNCIFVRYFTTHDVVESYF